MLSMGYGKSSSRSLLVCWAGPLLGLVLWFGLQPALAQDSPRELRQRATMNMAKGAFIDAIPDLEQLITYLGDSKKTTIIASMEMVYYNLGICHFFIGEFDEAEKTLRTYLRKYRHGGKRSDAAIYIADSLRFKGQLHKAVDEYRNALRKHRYTSDMKADIYSSTARCFLAEGKWHDAIEPLEKVYRAATDFLRRNWAATLLTTAYFKDLELDKIYPMVPYLLRPNSFASRSIAFNMAALEAGDALFAEERYRDALWVFRMVYPHDLVMIRSEEYLELLGKQAERLKERAGDPRQLMRLQESMGELEAEVEALEETENYDLELYSRIARGYVEMLRYWEAREIFLYLHENAEKKEAEEALFLAFQCSCQILPWDRAFELGEQYMEKYPAGEFFDILTLAMGQLYARQENWPEVIRHFTKTLEMSPRHQSAAECMFLMGYALFMEEKFQEAVERFRKIITLYPETDLAAATIYWIGMSQLFDGNYKEAGMEFDRVLLEHPNSMYLQDSAFRRAVCTYGMSLFDQAEERLKVFIAAYPKSRLTSEAIMMLGDVTGAVGRLDEAVKYYQRALTYDDLNIELYNHSVFQCGRILADTEEYERLRSHFLQYIERNREGSNIPQAIYWVGVALWKGGEPEGALRYYREAVAKYGKDPHQIGIDMILDEWIASTRGSAPELAKKAWKNLQEALLAAVRGGETTTALRLKRALLFSPNLKASTKQRLLDGLLKEDNLAVASPAVLQTMLDCAKEREQHDFAKKVAEHIIETFTETDYALDARMILAEFAIENARRASSRQAAGKHYAEAIKHLGVVREVFAASSEAGHALMLLGRLHLEQKKYGEADECYKSVLGVKGWRNLWPEALYGRGECAFASRRYDVASAYYERIYLMYSHYTAWTAKAYLRRAECLRRSYQGEKAREVLQEMLADTNLADLPEIETARELLAKMGGSS